MKLLEKNSLKKLQVKNFRGHFKKLSPSMSGNKLKIIFFSENKILSRSSSEHLEKTLEKKISRLNAPNAIMVRNKKK